MWIDTAKSGPTVKRLKLGKEGNNGTKYKGSQQLQEKKGASRKKSQKERKNATQDNGSKRARNETQATKEPSASEEKQRNMSAKEQLSNPGGKKGTVELLCASAVIVRRHIRLFIVSSHQVKYTMVTMPVVQDPDQSLDPLLKVQKASTTRYVPA